MFEGQREMKWGHGQMTVLRSTWSHPFWLEVGRRVGSGGVVTLDTGSKMYSDKQAQESVDPPHRWQVLQGLDTETLSEDWPLFGCSQRGGGASGTEGA